VRAGFNSNGTLLRRSIAERLVDMGLDWLHISLDGSSAQTYESIRDGATFSTVLDNLSGLVAAKRRAGREAPWIRVVFVAMRRNVEELPDLVDLLADVGVDELRVQNLSHDFGDTGSGDSGPYAEIRAYAHREALSSTSVQGGASFDLARERAAVRGVDLRLPALQALDPDAGGPGCTWPWDSAYVTSEGVVQPCCMVMGDDRVNLGRLGEASFTDIWNGPAYREFRQRLLDRDPPEVCKGCSLYRGTF
jgi:radical SAM protein with 4Fe4S-binding SPASM domain